MAINDGRVISNFIIQALQNKDITIYGDGIQSRSFCYVDDLINGMMMEKENICFLKEDLVIALHRLMGIGYFLWEELMVTVSSSINTTM
jgi:nucleoside-diphosphate-sugar epimerase